MLCESPPGLRGLNYVMFFFAQKDSPFPPLPPTRFSPKKEKKIHICENAVFEGEGERPSPPRNIFVTAPLSTPFLFFGGDAMGVGGRGEGLLRRFSGTPITKKRRGRVGGGGGGGLLNNSRDNIRLVLAQTEFQCQQQKSVQQTNVFSSSFLFSRWVFAPHPTPCLLTERSQKRIIFYLRHCIFCCSYYYFSFFGKRTWVLFGRFFFSWEKTRCPPLKTWGNCQWVSQKSCLKKLRRIRRIPPILKRELRICKGREGKEKG